MVPTPTDLHYLNIGCTQRGVVLCERVCLCLLSAFQVLSITPTPSKHPSKNPCPY